ncbi:MAG: type II toxin-antitoxin system RelE/ParE family toxin [Bacteroidetes bacterium]|nr:type II toxin-antitoxin system RelE/ParE family toxin [Bacteroidota bacterium]
MARIVWTLQAAGDLENIFDYIAKDSLKYARIQIIRIRNTVMVLKKLPRSGKVVPEIDNDEIRELISGNYRIIYRLLSEGIVEIITLHHSSRYLEQIQ